MNSYAKEGIGIYVCYLNEPGIIIANIYSLFKEFLIVYQSQSLAEHQIKVTILNKLNGFHHRLHLMKH